MERTARIDEAKKIFGNNFIGREELSGISERMGISLPQEMPQIPFAIEHLKEKSADYLLILGVSRLANGMPLTLASLRARFGIDPSKMEPCFYNQDWYLKESFVQKVLEDKWLLVRKSIFDDSRSKDPDILIKTHVFPSAVSCAYTFFANWYHSGEPLWSQDFVWCDDVDHNGDRIYIGRYYDTSGTNKNGLNIHRHLRIQDNYGCV
jgi:hypothetical protein